MNRLNLLNTKELIDMFVIEVIVSDTQIYFYFIDAQESSSQLRHGSPFNAVFVTASFT